MKNSKNYVMTSPATLTQSGLLAVLLQRQRRKRDRVGPVSHTPRAGACRLLETLARAPRRHRWSAIPARLWRNRSAAHLNLSPRQWRWLTKSTLTPNSGNRFTTTCRSNIPNGSSQMAKPPCVILTRRVSWNSSILSREGNSTNGRLTPFGKPFAKELLDESTPEERRLVNAEAQMQMANVEQTFGSIVAGNGRCR